MKKVILGGALALCFVGMSAVTSMVISNDTNELAVHSDITIIAQGEDAGGHYVIYDNGSQCVKVYPKGNGGHGVFDH